MQGQRRNARRFGSLLFLITWLLFGLVACGTGNGGNGSAGASSSGSGNIETPTPANSTATPDLTATASATGAAFSVLGVDMAVSPKSLNSYACGSNLTVTYTATFHFPANNPGGPVAFQYTTDNGRGSTPASLTVQPGQTTVAYQFTWSGNLPDDHTMPEPGGVMITAPNSLTSSLVGPSGSCNSSSANFSVLSVDVTASPSLDGHHCGDSFTEVYTATFHIAPNSPGGIITFTYTTDNGRGNSKTVSLHVDAGQTEKTYKFYWAGSLPADHTQPGTGLVAVSSPNAVTSSPGEPSGQCS